MISKKALLNAIKEYETNPVSSHSVAKLADCYIVYNQLFNNEQKSITTTGQNDYLPETELNDIFPALSKYKDEHNIINLQKLCIEIEEFCKEVYASTTNDDERQVYINMINNLKIL